MSKKPQKYSLLTDCYNLIMSRDFISLTNLTVSHLKQVIDKIATIREDDLSKLDQAVNTYLLKRK
jgi:hypothetical protein